MVGVVVGTKAHLSALHRRSFPSLKAGYTVDAHIEALVDERDVASSFVPGHCSRRKAPYTAKYISLHLSYRRPGVQPPPVRLSSTLAPAKLSLSPCASGCTTLDEASGLGQGCQ